MILHFFTYIKNNIIFFERRGFLGGGIAEIAHAKTKIKKNLFEKISIFLTIFIFFREKQKGGESICQVTY